MWRSTPLHRSEVALPPADSAGSLTALPPSLADDELQPVERGYGPQFRRIYRTQIADAELDPQQLMRAVQENLNRPAPSAFARFQKVSGADGGLRVGDEYVVRMPGPWDGPVRVIAADPDSFVLATLRGHLEAGQISFRAASGPSGRLVFEIESRARSSGPLVHLLYHRLRFAKEVQAHMWISFLEGVVRAACGRMTGGIEMRTERISGAADVDRALRGGPRVRRRLARLRDLPLNFEPASLARASAGGWQTTDLRRRVGVEAPGMPEPDGPWEAGRRAMQSYAFADPSIVRAYYDPSVPLERRDMVLRLQALGVLRLHAGVRVAGVRSETCRLDGRDAHVWGWSYQTLAGHPEVGQMDWELWKWLDTGEIDFRVHARSRRADDVNPLIRVVYRLLSRRERRVFLDSTVRRMRAFVGDGGRLASRPQAARELAAEITARHSSADDPSHDELARNLTQAGGR
jgi:uncharacterized protein (UPF0548 family)